MVWMVIFLTLANGKVVEVSRAVVGAETCLPLMEQTRRSAVFVTCEAAETGDRPTSTTIPAPR